METVFEHLGLGFMYAAGILILMIFIALMITGSNESWPTIGQTVVFVIVAHVVIFAITSAVVDSEQDPPQKCTHHHSHCSCPIEQQQKHYCPVCGSSDTDAGSLTIHCNDCGRDITIDGESAPAYFCPGCGSKAELVATDGDTVTLRCDKCGRGSRTVSVG